MIRLFKAVGRLFRAIIYSFVGDLSKWSKVWEESSSYIHAEYDDIEKEQRQSIDTTMEAVAGLQALNKEKEHFLVSLNAQIEDLKKKQVGAQKKAERQKDKLLESGKGVEEVKADPTIQKCLDYYHNFSSTLAAKLEEAERLENEIESHQKSLEKYKLQLQKAHDELKRIKAERHETVADMELAKQEEKVNAALSGITTSDAADRRARIQENRRKRRARADISSELAGIANESAEEEFLEFASSTEAESDFFGMLGLEERSEPEVSSNEQPSRIPE